MHFASAFALMARYPRHAHAHRRRLPARQSHDRADPSRPASRSAGRPSIRCSAASCTPGPRCTSTASAGCRSSPPPASACRPASLRHRRRSEISAPGRTSPRRRAPRHRGRPRIPWMTDSTAHRPRAAPRSPGRPAAHRQHHLRHPPRPVDPGPPAGLPRTPTAACGERWRCRRGVDAGAGRRDRPRHRGTGKRVARARWPRVWSASMGPRPSRCESSCSRSSGPATRPVRHGDGGRMPRSRPRPCARVSSARRRGLGRSSRSSRRGRSSCDPVRCTPRRARARRHSRRRRGSGSPHREAARVGKTAPGRIRWSAAREGRGGFA